jgi:uncharacterized protein DUF4381
LAETVIPPASPAISADPVAGLIDIPLPPAVTLWPQTWTSRITIALLLIGLVAFVVGFARRRWVNRYRREALAELEQITRAAADDPGALAAGLATLVRRTALAAFPREQVAALAGHAWLTFLDRAYGGTEFAHGAGRDLETLAYRPQPRKTSQMPLVDLVRRWIKVHHA